VREEERKRERHDKRMNKYKGWEINWVGGNKIKIEKG
jgi:hypothetical protein